ncbi:MAG: hypothetical protein DPW18_00600 [Chloroflexi bacterium]|nr:hypothetical protein [Chloroflexota bacterium]MDL1941308.1 PAS domain S-box protein [Chloroflexi bacterium CFX2]
MTKTLRILHLEDDPRDVELIRETLLAEGISCEMTVAASRHRFIAEIETGGYDLILADNSMPHYNGLHALADSRSIAPDLPFIFVSGTLGEEVAIEALKNGATDYVLKQRLSRLAPVVRRALEEVGAKRELWHAEQALVESEKRFRSLIENSADVIALVSAEGVVTYVSPSAFHVMGAQPNEAIHISIFDFIHPDDQARAGEQFEKILGHAASRVHFECRALHRDGTWHWLDVTGTNLLAEPHTNALVANFRDVTERKQAEEALRKSEEEYRKLFEDSPIALWVEDFSKVKQRLDKLKRNGVKDLPAYFRANPGFVHECAALVQIQDVNSAALKLYHARKKSELLGSLADTLATLSVEQFEQELIQMANGRLVFEREETDRTLTGSEIIVSVRWAVAPGYEDNLAKVIVSTLDVTDHRLAEKKIQRHLAELEALNRVSTVLRTAQAGESMFPALLDETLAALDCTDGAVWIYHPDKERLRVAVARGWFAQFQELPLKPGEGIAGSVFSSGEAHRSAEFASDPLARAPAGRTIPTGWGGVCVPIRSAAATLGVIFISARLPRQVTPEEMKLIESLAEMTGIALHRLSLYEETVRRLNQMQALQAIDRAITSSFDLRVSLGILLEKVTTLLNADAADVLVFVPHAQSLEYFAGRGFRSSQAERSQVQVGQGIAGRAALERRTLRVANVKEEPDVFPRGGLLADEGVVGLIVTPLIVKGQLLGALEVFHRSSFQPNDEWLDLFETLAGQAAIAIDNARSFENLQRSITELTLAYDTTIEGWSRAMDLRDKETEGHTQRVTEMTLRLARMAGMPSEELLHVRRGALLHDMGKLGIPDAILFKRTRLTAEEWDIMRRHPQYAYEMLYPIQYLRPALDIPYCHHEKWDGTGYPRGLAGSQIPLAARLFAVVDVWDALRSDRPYRKAWSPKKVRDYIRTQAGTHFDPQAVELFFQMMDEDGSGQMSSQRGKRKTGD